jgi:hypothetical protein
MNQNFVVAVMLMGVIGYILYTEDHKPKNNCECSCNYENHDTFSEENDENESESNASFRIGGIIHHHGNVFELPLFP